MLAGLPRSVNSAGPHCPLPGGAQLLSAFGGDVVGMSTVLEVIATRHMGGGRCLTFSSQTAADGASHEPGGGLAGSAQRALMKDEVFARRNRL